MQWQYDVAYMNRCIENIRPPRKPLRTESQPSGSPEASSSPPEQAPVEGEWTQWEYDMAYMNRCIEDIGGMGERHDRSLQRMQAEADDREKKHKAAMRNLEADWAAKHKQLSSSLDLMDALFVEELEKRNKGQNALWAALGELRG